jgi:eukaryotic-like serine/threonine-protein kinase
MLVAAALGLFCHGWILVAIARHWDEVKEPGWTAGRQADGWYVSTVDANGPADGSVRTGDYILTILGQSTSPSMYPIDRLRQLPAGETYSLRVRREGSTIDLNLRLGTTAPTGRRLLWMLSLFLAGAAFFALSSVAFIQPVQSMMWTGFAATLGLSLVFASESIAPLDLLLSNAEFLMISLLRLVPPLPIVFGYDFFSRFPTGEAAKGVWAKLRAALYVTAAICYVMLLPEFVATVRQLDFSEMWASAFSQIAYARSLLQWVVDLASSAAICGVLAHNYRGLTERNQRIRIRWVAYGVLAAVIPTLVDDLDVVIDSLLGQPIEPVRTWTYIANVASILIPITLGYALLKHRVLGTRVVIRLGLQYLLARQVLSALLVLPGVVLLASIIANPQQTFAEFALRNYTSLALVLAAILSLRYRRQLRLWLDRRFFREVYDQESILLNLVESIKAIESLSEVAKLASKEIKSALHPARLHVLYRDERRSDFTIGYSSEVEAANLRISENSSLTRVLSSQRSAVDVPMPRMELTKSDAAMLEQLGVSLIVPMSNVDGRLVGAILLGEKLSEEPYTARDRKILEAIAAQIAFVYENAALKERVIREHTIRRDVLTKLSQSEFRLLRECPACGVCFDSDETACPVDGAELVPSLPVERVIEGKYRLDRLLGKGGMGAVYEASDLRLNRKVAVKVMIGRLFGRRDALRRFEREAQAAAKLSHRNVVDVYDYGTFGNEGAYIVMQLLHGQSWLDLIQRGPFPPAIAAERISQLLQGLKAAHEAGIIHRDLKPANLAVVPDNGRELVKILDFGLAKMQERAGVDAETITDVGTVIGTYGYMSPEQLLGREADERADIFAVGVITAEALTGKQPFQASSQSALLTAIRNGEWRFPRPSPEWQRVFEILSKCLAPESADRFASVAAFEHDLVSAIRSCPAVHPAQTTPSDPIATRARSHQSNTPTI